MEANEKYYKEKGHSLFSSHADLSEEPIEENIKFAGIFIQNVKIGMTLEIELGSTGGEEDGLIIVELMNRFILNPKKLLCI